MRLQLTALAYRAYTELSSVERESEARLSQIFERMGELRQQSRLADTSAPAWCREVRETLDANRVDPPSLHELAEIVRVNRAHLARTFRKWTGCSVGEYSRALKIEATILPLARSRARAFEIAHRAGFADQSHFTRVFRSIFGVSPAAFRRDFLHTNEKF